MSSDTLLTNAFLGTPTRAQLASILGVKDKHLCYVLYGLRERSKYNEFEIPKKNGGSRILNAPPLNLRRLQSRLLRLLEQYYEPRPCVHGFVADRSVLSNGNFHCNKKYVFNIDLLDFFPSIHIGRVIGVFQGAPYELPNSVAVVIGQIACMDNGTLPQGAPTSPLISNIICRPLDTALQHIAQNFGCTYTRYADDISISTNRNEFPSQIAFRSQNGGILPGKSLKKIIHSHGFRINTSKIWLRSRSESQTVTGLTVNEFPNVSRKYVRNLRATLFDWEKNGYEQAAKNFEAKFKNKARSYASGNDRFRNFVHGRLAYLQMVRGSHDPIYRKLRAKLHFIDPDNSPEPIRIGDAQPTPLRGIARSKTDWQKIFSNCAPSIYMLEIDSSRDGDFAPTYCGTAFNSKSKHLITAGHNLHENDVRIGMPLDKSIPPVESKYKNVIHGVDCGLLRAALPPARTKQYLSSQERVPEIGEEVAAIGYPRVPFRDTALVLHVGVVSALVRSFSNELYIQVSFISGGGLSGAPLIDKHGYVLGIMTENVFDQPDEIPPVSYGQALPIGYVHYLSKEPWIKHDLSTDTDETPNAMEPQDNAGSTSAT